MRTKYARRLRAHLILAASSVGLIAAGSFAVPAGAQTYRASVGCSLGTLPANITADELRCQCYQMCGGAVVQPPPVTTPTPTPTVTEAPKPTRPDAIDCGTLRFLATRASVGFPEGHTAQAEFNKHCGGNKPSDHVPTTTSASVTTTPTRPAELQGSYRFVRGYSNRNPGADKSICQSSYEGTLSIRDGRVTFDSGGHEWRGVITSNKWILISRDGISPKPKNPTVITGPIENASLYNGYCGKGFFRLVGR